MKLLIQRKGEVKDANGEALLGDIFCDGHWEGFTLEDVHREVKVAGQTCIPAGTYQILQRKVMSGLTKRYVDKYSADGFDWHLELQGVPNFENVYIHIGNYAKDTEGCILVGSGQTFGQAMISQSKTRFFPLYIKVRDALQRGEHVEVEIRDEHYRQ